MNKYIEEDYFYTDKKRISKCILFAIVTFIIFKLLNYINCYNVYKSEDIFYAVFSVCTCIVIYKLIDFKNNFIAKLIMLIYGLVIFQSMVKVLSIYLQQFNKLIIGDKEENIVILYAVCLLFLVAEKTYDNAQKYYVIYLSSIIGTFMLLLLSENDIINKSIILILDITCIHILAYVYKISDMVKKIKYKGKINVIAIAFHMILLISLISLAMIFMNDRLSILKYIYQVLFHFIFIFSSSVLLFRTINMPFKSILESLYIKNKQLDGMNQQVFRQNVFLEYSKGLRDNKNKTLSLFFNNMPLPIVIIDKESERIEFSNNKFLELIEEDTYKKIINKKLFSLFEIEDDGFIKDINSIIRGVVNKKGKKKYIDIEIFDDDENDVVIVIFTDVTEQIKMLKIKEKIKNKAFEEQMKRDFLSNISHDLKTPINVIYTAAQLMDVYCDQGNKEGIDKYISICKNNYESLIKLTDSLINKSKNFSFYSDINLQVVNIVSVIRDNVMTLVEYAQSKGVSLTFDSSENLVYAEVDTDCMERIVQNIISNSLKYYRENGKIQVSISTNDEEVKITFKDNGIGMDEETLNNVFIRYSMGENSKLIKEKGTGIGLSVVKKMVNKQSGKINIYSKLNVGTKVEILFKRVNKYE